MGGKKNSSFDSAAKSYDKTFTFSETGKLQRDRVYYWLDKIGFFQSKKNVFEINCGTGFDAKKFALKGHLVTATDKSAEMIKLAKESTTNIDFFRLDITQLNTNNKLKKSNVLFSNFGGLNCIDNNEMNNLIKHITATQKQKDLIIWVLMSRFCLSEAIYFLLKLKFSKVLRRNTNKAVSVNVDGQKVNTYYYSPQKLKKKINQNYRTVLLKPVAIFLPPSYTEQYFKKNKKILKLLNNLEHIFGRFTFLARWSDHYIIIAEKK